MSKLQQLEQFVMALQDAKRTAKHRDEMLDAIYHIGHYDALIQIRKEINRLKGLKPK